MTSESTWPRGRSVAVGCLVTAAGLVMGAWTLRGGFVGGDDHRLALNHVLVNHPSLEHAVELFTTFHRDLYQPLPLLSFQAEFAMTKLLGLYDQGPDAFGWLFHLDNVLLHGLNTLLVYLLLVRLQGRVRRRCSTSGSFALGADAREGSDTAWPVAAIAAMLFAIHPIQTEVVAWLNGRMFLMSTFFGLAGFLSFMGLLERVGSEDEHDRRGAAAFAVLTCLLLTCSALSKVRPGFVILLVIIALVYRARLEWRLAATWLVCVGIAVAFSLINIRATSEAELFALGAEHLRGPRAVRVLLALECYFRHFVWPVGLASYYPTPPVVSWTDPETIRALAIVLVGLAVMAFAAWRSRAARFGIVWFFVAIADTLPFVPARNVLAADRYIYVPIIGLLWPLAQFVHAGYRAWLSDAASWVRRAAVPAAVGAFCLTLIGICWYTASFYETALSKTGRVASLFPDVPRVAEKLGWSYFRVGDYAQAIALAEKELSHDVPEVQSAAYQLMGMAHVKLGNAEQGLELLHKALQVDPDSTIGKYRLADAYDELGRYAEAVKYYEEAVAEAPSQNPTIQRLAQVYRRLGYPDKARAMYEQQLENNPYEVPAIMGLAELDLAQGTPASLRRAEQRLLALLDWMPENLDAWVNLGATYAAQGRTKDAVQVYRHVLSENPSHQTAALNLAQIFYGHGDVERAAPLFELAIRSRPVTEEVSKLTEEFRRVYAVFAALKARRYQEAVAAADALYGPDPSDAQARRRLLTVLQRYDEQHPGNPWTFCLVAQLTIADKRMDAAKVSIDVCEQQCQDPACHKRVRELREQLPVSHEGDTGTTVLPKTRE